MEKWNKATLKKVSWNDVRKEVSKVNPELAKIIDEINPDAGYTLFEASYPFGSEPLQKGRAYFPDPAGDLLALNDSKTSAELQECLSYNLGTNPVSLVLENSFEIFMLFKEHTIPFFYGLIPPGKILSTWRVLSTNKPHAPAFLWHMTAGARSLYTLPKISELKGNTRLKRVYGLKSAPPKNLLDHWHLFRELTQHPSFGEKWSARMLFFGKKWFDKLHDPAWIKFRAYLLQAAWDGSEFWRNQFIWDLAFSLIQERKHMRPDPYIRDTVKHLFTIAVGAIPGFAPALGNEAAPIERLQEVLLNDYRLGYAPIIMQPTFFSLYDEIARPVYYSLEYPGAIEFSPSSRATTNKIMILSDIHYLLERCLSALREQDLNVIETPLYDLPHLAKFDFFHTETSNYEAVRNSVNIPLEDAAFLKGAKYCRGQKFPANCSFVKGCIRISR
jgi:hypothetical protein